MNESQFQQWLEAAQRGQLTLPQVEELARQEGGTPEKWETLRREIMLSKLVADLPPIPVSFNFTHRVLEAVEKEQTAHDISWRHWLARYWPRLAIPAAAAAAAAIYLGVSHYQSAAQRAQWAASLEAVATLATAPSPAAEMVDLEVWENFDVILRMGSLTSDAELLRVIQTPQ